MASQWKLLNHENTSEASIPPLLVKHDFGPYSYKIWVTDLINVWSEALGQRPLVQRAWDIETDIDPLESDQRQTLLQKIEDSLNGAPGTKLALSRSSDLRGIQLTAFSPLPKPLKALQWPFHLASSAKITLTSELILPLLDEQLRLHEKLNSLLEIIRDKDHVSSKLKDKLQAEGIEMGEVFPGAVSPKSSRKAVSDVDGAKFVKGLGPFDEEQWRRQWIDDCNVSGSYRGLLSKLSAKTKGFSSLKVGEQLPNGDWWEHLNAEIPLADDGETKVSPSQSQSSAANDFQRQITPDPLDRTSLSGRTSSAQMILPQRGINAQTKTQESADDGSTTGASDEDLEPVQLKPKERRQNLKPTSEQDSSSQSSSPEPARDTRGSPSSTARGVLGRIGGPSKPSVPPTKPKLGQIGGTTKREKSPMPVSKSPEPRGRPLKQPESPLSPVETSRERADRKREQLKRELEEKSRLGAKKKRKF
ncbi:MAG: hypothetical protein Q9208_008548 [Pyrenodesmia sp. 3 TL-2023]